MSDPTPPASPYPYEPVDDVHKGLMEIRRRRDLKARLPPLIRPRIKGPRGDEVDFALRYYQIQGVYHLLSRSRFLLGDDTGLGKTVITIAALTYLWEKEPNLKVLILTVKSSVGQWAKEIARFTDGVQVFVCDGDPKARGKVRAAWRAATGPAVLIYGYRSAVKDILELQDDKGYALITDEAAAYKNPQAQVYKTVQHFSKQCSRMWALTATMIKNNLEEAWAILKLLVPGLFGSKSSFLDEFCIVRMQPVPKSRVQIPVIVGYRKGAIPVFKERIDPFYLGRPKWEVASDLPPLIVREVDCELTPEQTRIYDEVLNGLVETTTKEGVTEEKEVSPLTAVTYCQEVVNHPELLGRDGGSGKLETLVEMLEGEFASTKVIVFSRFSKMIEIIGRALNDRGIRWARITGAEVGAKRAAEQEKFQDFNSGVDVILITTAASEAVNLQSASAMIFVDTPFSAGDLLQLYGRMLRIGSIHDRCYALHLVVPGTVDDHVMKIVNGKMDLIEKVLGKRLKGEEDEVFVLPENDLSELFEALRDDARRKARKYDRVR